MNIYDEIDDLCKALNELGFYEFVNEVKNIVSSGATGTEILMGVSWIFNSFLINNSSNLNSGARRSIKRLLKEISRSLRA